MNERFDDHICTYSLGTHLFFLSLCVCTANSTVTEASSRMPDIVQQAFAQLQCGVPPVSSLEVANALEVP